MRFRGVTAVSFALLAAVPVAYAQFGRFSVATRESFDGAFQFCRLAFHGVQVAAAG